MKLHSFLLLILSATSALADDKPATKTYACEEAGCSAVCATRDSKWNTLASGSNKVTINHYASGGVEFLFDKEVILLGSDFFQCKVTGIKI